MKVYLLVMAIAAATTYVAVPIIRHIALVGNALTPVRARDVHSTPIPRLGGVAMFFGLFSAISVASTIPYLSDVIDSSAWAVVMPTCSWLAMAATARTDCSRAASMRSSE